MEDSSLVTREIAEEDVNRWLDYRKTRQSYREKNKDQIEQLIELVEDGLLSIDDECNMTLQLIEPLKDKETGASVKNELTFKPRITQLEVTKHLKGTSAQDIDGRVLAYIAAATGTPKGYLNKLDVSDYNTAQSIVMFFLG